MFKTEARVEDNNVLTYKYLFCSSSLDRQPLLLTSNQSRFISALRMFLKPEKTQKQFQCHRAQDNTHGQGLNWLFLKQVCNVNVPPTMAYWIPLLCSVPVPGVSEAKYCIVEYFGCLPATPFSLEMPFHFLSPSFCLCPSVGQLKKKMGPIYSSGSLGFMTGNLSQTYLEMLGIEFGPGGAVD